MNEVFRKKFKVIHTNWNSWVEKRNRTNVWGAKFTDQWSNRRGVLIPSTNSDLGALSRARAQNSDYGSIPQNAVNE